MTEHAPWTTTSASAAPSPACGAGRAAGGGRRGRRLLEPSAHPRARRGADQAGRLADAIARRGPAAALARLGADRVRPRDGASVLAEHIESRAAAGRAAAPGRGVRPGLPPGPSGPAARRRSLRSRRSASRARRASRRRSRPRRRYLRRRRRSPAGVHARVDAVEPGTRRRSRRSRSCRHPCPRTGPSRQKASSTSTGFPIRSELRIQAPHQQDRRAAPPARTRSGCSRAHLDALVTHTQPLVERGSGLSARPVARTAAAPERARRSSIRPWAASAWDRRGRSRSRRASA